MQPVHEDSELNIADGTSPKPKKLTSSKESEKHQLRTFWNRCIQPKLFGEARASLFLKLFGSNFSWQLFTSLTLIFEELGLPIEQLIQFENTIMEAFHNSPSLKEEFPQYAEKFIIWCSKEQHRKRYKGKNYEKYRTKIKTLFISSNKIPEEPPLKKCIKTDPLVARMKEEFYADQKFLIQEVQKTNQLLQNLTNLLAQKNWMNFDKYIANTDINVTG